MAVKGRRETSAPERAADRYNAWSFGASMLGWGALLLGQRVLAAGGAVKLFTGLALLLLVGSFGQRIWSMLEASDDRRPAAQVMAVLSGLGLVALLLFAATSDWGRDKLGIAKPTFGEPDTFGEVGTVVWISLVVISVLPSLLGELARWAMVRAEHFESRRVVAAIAAGLAVSFAVVYGSLFTFGSSFIDWSADFSYARVAKPSESTLRMMQSMEEPLEVRLYFPGHSEIGKKVEKYFDDLRAMGGQFEVQTTDRYLVPDQAKDDRVTRDGVVVLRRGEQSEKLDIGVDEGRAVPKLKKLDGEFQKTLIKVIRDRRTVYLTVGHGELNESTDPKGGRTVRVLRELLQSQNYVLKNLGLKEGLANEVPDDASIVAVLGPTNPLTEAEVESLRRYAEAGGSLLLALDPDAKVDLSALAAIAGLQWRQPLVINDRTLVPVSRGPSDKKNLVVTRFSSHASVSTASKAVAQGYALVLLGASPLDALDAADKSYAIDYVFKSPPGSYVEEVPNWSFDSDSEKKATYNLAAAVTRPVDPSEDAKQAASRPGGAEMRAFVVADADLFADRAMASSRLLSRLVLVEALRWLGGEESFSGEISSEEDVAIVHTKEEDALWFYGMILAIPSLVLGGGIAFTRRRPRKKAARRDARDDDASAAGEPSKRKQRRKKAKRPASDSDSDSDSESDSDAESDSDSGPESESEPESGEEGDER